MEIISSALVLFSVIDIFGSVPILLDLKNKSGKIEAEKATIVALLIMVLFLFLGNWILKLFSIDVASFAIAGAIIIFLIAGEMILGVSIFKDVEAETASIVPIAFPLIAGAGTMTTLISLRAEYGYLNILAGVVVNLLLVYLVIRNLNFIEKLLGKNGLNVVRKVFGIILLAIAIKLFKANMFLELV